MAPRVFSPFNTFLSVFQSGSIEEPRSVTDLFNRFMIEMESSEYCELGALLAFFRAVAAIHQSNHWRAKGDTFYGDHLMFERVYDKMIDEIDSIAERAVGLGDESLVDPEKLARMQSSVCEWVCSVYAGPSSLPMANSLARLSLSAEECLYAAIELCSQVISEKGKMRPGLRNLLDGLADSHESSQYLLSQACSE